jgi:hypothetical protein
VHEQESGKTVMNDVQENLLARFIDDREALSEPDFHALLAALRGDAEMSRLLKDLLIVDDVCAQMHSIDRKNFRAQVAARLRDQKNGGGMKAEVLLKRFSEPRLAPVPRPSSSLWRTVAVLAACVAVAALVALAFKPSEPEGTARANAPVAVLKTTAPGVRVRRGAVDLPASGGMQMLSDDTLINPLEGDVQIALAGQESTFVLHAGTHIHIANSPRGLRVHLAQGSVKAVLGPQPKDRPLVIVTASAEISIVGTELNVAVASNETHVDVVKGSVNVVRIDDGEAIRVDANYSTRVVPGRELISISSQVNEIAEPKKPEAAPQTGENGWRKIFDGKSMDGWKSNKGSFAVENGCLVGTAEKALDQSAVMTEEKFQDYELRYSFKIEGAIYLETRNRVSGAGSLDLQVKDKDSAWHQCVIQLSGLSGKAIIDGTEAPMELLGQLPPSGRIRFYMQNRGPAGVAKLLLKDIEVRELKAAK